MKEKEIRKLDIQLRASEAEDNKMEIKGYAVVFNSPETYYGYTEVIAPTAFDEADMSDVVLRYNHNDSFIILARTRNKSLKLDTDGTGLSIDAFLQEDISDHRNIFNAIKTQLIDKQSFGFTVEEDEYDYESDTRTITKIGKLFDVSVARNISDDFLKRRAELRKEYEAKEALKKAKERLISKLG